MLTRPLASRAGARRGLTALAATAALAPLAAFATPEAAATAAPTAPPPVRVTTGTQAVGSGDIFVAPFSTAGTYASGAEILDRTGQELWFHPAPAGEEDSDFRPATLHGQPVLTFWQGTGLGGLATGTDYVYNTSYQPIATVHAGDGLSADGHEFLLTDKGDAWIVAYKEQTANLTSMGGNAKQKVINGYVQEIDVKTGKVLFNWSAAKHVPYSQSEQTLPAKASTPWDWFHVNAVKVTSDGNLLIDARDTWTTYKVNSTSGKIIWQLGGKDSTFQLEAATGQRLNKANEIFAWQHDPQQVGPNTYTVFDNESAGVANTGVDATSEYKNARVVTIKLDPKTKVATLVASDNEPQGQDASSQGNGDRLTNGDELVGWGILPDVSEFSSTGTLLFNLRFPAGVNTYRAYLAPWSAPAPAPAE